MANGDMNALPALFTYRDAIEAGVSKQRLYAMRDTGRIQSVARGIYVRADNVELIDLDLAEIAIRQRRSAACRIWHA
jgi:hypothetical protein